jgi:hypothetical protein
MAMPPTRRRNRLSKGNTPEALAARFPDELQSFSTWYRRDGLRDYLAVLSDHIAPHEPIPVMNAAGLSAAGWFRHMLSLDGSNSRCQIKRRHT